MATTGKAVSTGSTTTKRDTSNPSSARHVHPRVRTFVDHLAERLAALG